MINKQNIFDHPVKINLRTYNKIRKIASGQGNDYTASSLLDYNYCNKYYKMIALDLSRQQAVDTDPKGVHQIKVINRGKKVNENTVMFFIIKKARILKAL